MAEGKRRSALGVRHEHWAGWSVREWCIKIYITIKIQHIVSTNKGNDLWNILFSIIYLFAFISSNFFFFFGALLSATAASFGRLDKSSAVPSAKKRSSGLENRHQARVWSRWHIIRCFHSVNVTCSKNGNRKKHDKKTEFLVCAFPVNSIRLQWLHEVSWRKGKQLNSIYLV